MSLVQRSIFMVPGSWRSQRAILMALAKWIFSPASVARQLMASGTWFSSKAMLKYISDFFIRSTFYLLRRKFRIFAFRNKITDEIPVKIYAWPAGYFAGL